MLLLSTLLILSSQAPAWQPVPLVTAEMRAAGHRGGEGGQWPRSVVYSPRDPSFALFGTDVGGVFRSLDGGVNWEPANVGFTARGSTDFAFDPHNDRRILAVGMNSGPGTMNGLYLSEDRAASWRPVMNVNIAGNSDMRGQVAFDSATYDDARGLTRVAYWSRIRHDNENWGNRPEIKPRIYRSEDGGRTWMELPNSERYAGGWLRMHPQGRVLYVGTDEGVFRSADGARTFRQTLNGRVTGLDVVPSAPKTVFASTADNLWRSDDEGLSWRPLPSMPPREGMDEFRNLKASPADANRLAVWRLSVPNTWNWPRFVSHDGGRTWHESKKDSTGAFLPDNAREGLFAWHPKDPNVLLSIGGDWPKRSTDGGRTLRYSGQGYNVVLVGGRFAFSVVDPDTLFVGSQDYNGAVTYDRGHTWKYTNISGNGWGGFCYGGYAVTRNFLVVGNADGWGSPRILRVSQDGGRTWTDTGIELRGADTSYGMPGDPRVAFAFDHRTEDGGRTWARMEGNGGVFTNAGTSLYGRGADARTIVRSDDAGRTWTPIATAPAEINDLAVDPVAGRIYVAAGLRAHVWDGTDWSTLETRADARYGHAVRTVAVDPAEPNIVWVGSAGNFFATSVAVQRSTDRGKTWLVFTRNEPLMPGVVDGGREALVVRVHPRSRDLYVATSCYGIWRLPYRR